MSFAVRLCSNLLKCAWGKVAAEPLGCRNFHMLMQAPQLSSPVSTNDGAARLLTPTSSLITQVAGFKVKGRLKPRCKDCYYVIRQQRHYIICPTHPRHKQMSMKKRDYKSWILTHATQSKVRPY